MTAHALLAHDDSPFTMAATAADVGPFMPPEPEAALEARWAPEPAAGANPWDGAAAFRDLYDDGPVAFNDAPAPNGGAPAPSSGAPRAIKIPPLLPADTGPPGVRPDSPLVPKVKPVPSLLDKAKKLLEPPREPRADEHPKNDQPREATPDRPGTVTVGTPGIPFDETEPFRPRPATPPHGDAKPLPKPPAPAPAPRPPEPKKSTTDKLIDTFAGEPHVALYVIYREFMKQREQKAREEARKKEAEEKRKASLPPEPEGMGSKAWRWIKEKMAPAPQPAPAPAPAPVEPAPTPAPRKPDAPPADPCLDKETIEEQETCKQEREMWEATQKSTRA